MRSVPKLVLTCWLLILGLSPQVVYSQVSGPPHVFVNGTAADADQVNVDFSTIYAAALNRGAGTMTGTLNTLNVLPTVTNASDLGSTSVFYRTAHLRTSLILGQTTANYTLTWANPASARAISIADPGGTDVFTFNAATQTLTNKTLTTPVLSGAVSGTYTLGGSGSITSGFGSIDVGTDAISGGAITATVSTAVFGVTSTQTGTSNAGFRLTRSAGTTSTWDLYTPSGSTNVLLESSAGAQLTLTTGGLLTTTGGHVGTTGAFSSTLNATGNFAVNTNKFTVTASNGNTDVAGVLTVASSATATSAVTVNDAAGTSRDFRITTAGSLRWIIRGNGTAETGANAGTNLQVFAFDDAGSLIGTPLAITRSSLATTLGGAVSLTSTLGVAGVTTSTVNAATFALDFQGANGGGITASNAAGALRFYTGSSTLRWGINAAGDWAFGASSHIADSNGTPVITSGFGTSPTIAGTDYAMTVALGSGSSTTGLVTFGHTFAAAPVCVAVGTGGAGVVISPITRVDTTTTTVSLAYGASGGAVGGIQILCRGY